MDTELLVVCYDRAELVPVIKGQQQLARTEQVGGCARGFDPSSTDLIPSSQFQPWLRANSKAARDGIAASLAMNVLADEKWAGDQKSTGTVAFYGVGGEVGLRDVQQYDEVSNAFGADSETDEGGWYGSGREHLLHFRNGSTSGRMSSESVARTLARLSFLSFILSCGRRSTGGRGWISGSSRQSTQTCG